MIAAFVVLLIVALGLGGYIVYSEVAKKRKAADAAEEEAFERARNYLAVQSVNGAEITSASAAGYARTPSVGVESATAFDDEVNAISSAEEAQSGTVFKPSDIRRSVTAEEADSLMQDEVAASLIEDSDGTSDKTKTGIVNIDSLSQYFESGETVTLDEIKKRVKGFNKNTTYLKVLARGTLDKNLIVEADSFSLQAVKMIVLTGGTAVKKQ